MTARGFLKILREEWGKPTLPGWRSPRLISRFGVYWLWTKRDCCPVCDVTAALGTFLFLKINLLAALVLLQWLIGEP